MDEGTATELALAAHILSIVIVLSTVCLCVALGLVSRALETWLPSLAVAIRRDRVDGAERH
jgi:hypothetical protein